VTQVTYVFSLQSPWSYIGHAAFVTVARTHGVTIDYRPANLGRIFPETGGLPLSKRHPARQAYRMLELQRWRLQRGLAMNLQPAHWPFDPSLADTVVAALAASGDDVERILPSFFAAVFERDENLADKGLIARLLDDAGLDSVGLLEAAGSVPMADLYVANARHAVDLGVIGAPSYILDGEIFWGQDRIDMLDAALAARRAPFRANV
jgi:2-hydroxychromene-2-carboxylate isomerase